jgi:soluble lytic murein transglycosylase
MVQTGDGAAGRTALRAVAEQHSAAREAAAPALLLLADLQVDDNDVTGAAKSLHDLVTRYPTASQAPLARFRLGLLQWASAPASSAATFDSLAAAHPGDEEAIAARYWAARAYASAGKKSDADQRWRAIIKDAPLSYYAMLSAKRLAIPGWSAPTGADTAAHTAHVDSAVQRIIVLQRLGMDVEARFEIDALAARAEATPADAPAVAQALDNVNEPARALRVALAAIDKGNASRALFRIAYPIVHDDALVAESRRNDLDPALVAGLIRQESSWNPRAVSVASARGLMQLLPSVGASIAASRKYPLWNSALLFDPDVSLELGTAHLASSLKRNTPPERALAAYNAGASRVTRWLARPGTDDAELFAEWIPFTETRDYVRVVLRNAAVYRALYATALGG